MPDLKLAPQPKIPSTCKCCHETLSRSDMERWLSICENTGTDPMDAARGDDPGILCFRCFARALMDTAEDEADPQHDKIVQYFRKRRRAALGLALVK